MVWQSRERRSLMRMKAEKTMSIMKELKNKSHRLKMSRKQNVNIKKKNLRMMDNSLEIMKNSIMFNNNST